MADFIKTLGGNSALSDGSGKAWSNITRVLTLDGSFADSDIAKNDVSQYAKSYNFNFGIEDDATINGIIMRLTRKGENSNITDTQVYLMDTAQSAKGSNYAKGETWDGVVSSSYGGVADLWGTTWSVSDINNANFGAMVEASNGSGTASRNAEIDYIEISIYYSRPDVTPMMLSMGAF